MLAALRTGTLVTDLNSFDELASNGRAVVVEHCV